MLQLEPCLELLVNFACSSRARGIDLGNVLVFPTDKETKELAEGLGLTTFYDEKVSASRILTKVLELLSSCNNANYMTWNRIRIWGLYLQEVQRDMVINTSLP